MEAKITCSVINDLLPLYADNALSRDSRALVEEHLEGCKFCTAELEGMKKTITIESDRDGRHIKRLKSSVDIKRFIIITLLSLTCTIVLALLGVAWGKVHFDFMHGAAGELTNYFIISGLLLIMFAIFWYWILFLAAFIRRVIGKPKMESGTVKRICMASACTMISIYLVVTLGFFMMYYGSAAKSEDITLRPEFQYSEDSLLQQEWVLHFSSKDNKTALNVFREEIYNGDGIVTGVIYTVHEVPIKAVLESSSYTVGYSHGDNETMPPHSFDFTVTVVFSDKTISYSMRDEGLFKKQDNVLYSPDSPNQEQKHDPQNITARTAANGEDTYVYD